jgi:hypothetical protein
MIAQTANQDAQTPLRLRSTSVDNDTTNANDGRIDVVGVVVVVVDDDDDEDDDDNDDADVSNDISSEGNDGIPLSSWL